MTDSETSLVHHGLAAFRAELQAFESEPAARLLAALGGLGDEIRETRAVQTETCKWLKPAFAARPPETAALLDALAPVAGQAAWHEGPRASAPKSFREGYAYTVLAGPDGQVPSLSCRVGFYIQRPALHYPAHAHDAEELYFVLSGGADWQAGERHFTAAPGQLIHHAPGEPHTMVTDEQPFFALFAWLGEIEGHYWFL